MDPIPPSSEPGISFKGTAGLVIAIIVVSALLIAFPTYRWFLLISVAIGLAVAAILAIWHKLNPIKEEDIENKRPLGLD
jgi:4-amino-4-deoxy-L-arabinose transferase-like glycosyltransferase